MEHVDGLSVLLAGLAAGLQEVQLPRRHGDRMVEVANLSVAVSSLLLILDGGDAPVVSERGDDLQIMRLEMGYEHRRRRQPRWSLRPPQGRGMPRLPESPSIERFRILEIPYHHGLEVLHRQPK